MKLDKKAIEWITQEHAAGRTLDEISLDTGLSKPSVKRALSEAGVLELSWHKSDSEHKLLQLLSKNGIKTVSDITKYKLTLRE